MSTQTIQASELQREILKTELEGKVRTEAITALRAAGLSRDLNNNEKAALIADVDKLLLGRDAWLKQMREAKIRFHRRQLTLAEEAELNTEVRALLNANSEFIKNYKYDAADANSEKPSATTANSLEAVFMGIFSGIINLLGLGNGPLGDFFKGLGKFFSSIFSTATKTGEQLNPKKTPADLIKEGALDKADVALEALENEVIEKLSEHLPNADIKTLMDDYQAELNKLKIVDPNMAGVAPVPFSETTDDYKKQTLRLRERMRNDILTSASPLFKAHENLVAAQKKRESEDSQRLNLQNRINDIPDVNSPERKGLKDRMESLLADVNRLQAEQDVLRQNELGILAAPLTQAGQPVSLDQAVRDRANAHGNATNAAANPGCFYALEVARQRARIQAQQAQQAAAQAAQLAAAPQILPPAVAAGGGARGGRGRGGT